MHRRHTRNPHGVRAGAETKATFGLSALLAALVLLSGAAPASAGGPFNPQPVVAPVGGSRPAAAITGIDRAELSASIDWYGDHVVYLTRPARSWNSPIVRLSSSGSVEVSSGVTWEEGAQPNHLAARRIGSMVYLVYGTNNGTWMMGTSYDGGRNFFWTPLPTEQYRSDLYACPVIADVYGGPMVFVGYSRWQYRDYGMLAMWPNGVAPNIKSWGVQIIDSAGDPDRPNDHIQSFCPRATVSVTDEIHVFSVKSDVTTSSSVGRHAWWNPWGGWGTGDFGPGASGELARGMSAIAYGNDVWVSWNRGGSFNPLIGGSSNEETWAQRWSAGGWAEPARRVMAVGRQIPSPAQWLPDARRDRLESNIYNSQCMGIVRGMPVVVAGEALSGVLAGTGWNGYSVANLDPLYGWTRPRIQLQNGSSSYWGSLMECQTINGRLSVGGKDIFGGYRFQLFN